MDDFARGYAAGMAAGLKIAAQAAGSPVLARYAEDAADARNRMEGRIGHRRMIAADFMLAMPVAHPGDFGLDLVAA